MPNWKEYKLGELAKFQEGYVNPSQTKAEYFDGSIKWLRANDLNGSFVYIITNYGGNFQNYFNAVYEIFDGHFIKTQPHFNGVGVSSPRYPEVDGRSRTFYHISHEGDDEQNRQPDFR